jgi:hypothetical protein
MPSSGRRSHTESSPVGPEDAWARRELASAVARAIDSLPPEQGVVVELTF